MLHKWKSILTNWINCYSGDSTKKEECVTLESLLNIISHLHNLSLDESKSSIIEAHTVEEFLNEKFPEFKFENGTIEPMNQEEIYLAASLLLYFVCVNSKDTDIKTVMCSKLCGKDQEIILKFSKRLMECSSVTCRDVQAAIIEACGEQIAGELTSFLKVSETPPALRSLHGEVRRLQAALDAERFDRNYLQEELTRTNFKIEKLSKDKEQFKIEIVGLKAKLSAVGQDVDDRSAVGGGEGPTKLAKQLEQLEERLVAAQEQLDEALYERDTYKARTEELKQDRDKWLSISQSEVSRATQLAEELESERSSNRSLKELVNELRQHNQRNCLDASQLECDDADAISLHNASVSSEACVNVIEVQLGEEKAKVVALKQHIQALQDQLNAITQKAQDERQTIEKIVAERENDIFELKHRINEEIEEKNLITANYTDEICKLNNEITELEQKLKDTTEHSRQFIDQQLIDIQTLQEEKLSLIQSLSDESSKLEQVISEVRNELENEKIQKQNMKDDYENQMMKLKEKILNRNNELVELQNNICVNSETIENLNHDLRKEKHNKEKLIERHSNEIAQLTDKLNTVGNELKQKTNEANELQKRLNQNVAVFTEMNKEIDELKLANTELEESCKRLIDEKAHALTQLQQSDVKIEELEKYIDNLKNQYEQEKNNLIFTLDEKVATVNTLQMQLHAEIQYKSGLENELCHLRQARSSLSDEVKKLSAEIELMKSENLEKERTIYALDLYLKEEKHVSKTSKQECDKLNNEIKNILQQISDKEDEKKEIILTKDSEIKELEERLETESAKASEELRMKDDIIESTLGKFNTITAQKEEIESKLTSLLEEKDKIASDLKQKCIELTQLQEDLNQFAKMSEDNVASIAKQLNEQHEKYQILQEGFDTQTTNLMTKLNEKEKHFKELYSKSLNTIKDNGMQIESLKIKITALENIVKNCRENVATLEKERDAYKQQLDLEISHKDKFEQEYQKQFNNFHNTQYQLSSTIASKTKTIETLKMEIDKLTGTIEEKTAENKTLEEKLIQESNAIQILVDQKNSEVKNIKKEVEQLNTLNIELENRLKNETESKLQAIEALQRENEQLHFTIEEDNSNHEVIMKEKDKMIERLEEHLKVVTMSLESVRKDYEDGTLLWEKAKIQYQQEIESRNVEVKNLNETIINLNVALEKSRCDFEEAKQTLIEQIKNIEKQSNEVQISLKEQSSIYLAELNQLNDRLQELENENRQLISTLDVEKGERALIESEKQTLIQERADLINKNTIIIQELSEEKSMRLIAEQEKQALINEKDEIVKRLETERSTLNSLENEKQIISQQLLEEKSVTKVLDVEKASLKKKVDEIVQEKLAVESQKDEYLKQLQELDEANKNLLTDLATLNKKLDAVTATKKELFTEKEILHNDNQMLKNYILELETVKEAVIHDKEMLQISKEDLLKSLSEEKSVRDEMESEKNKVSDNLKELAEKYASDMALKQEELQNMDYELKSIKTDIKKHEETNALLTFSLNSGLEKLLQNIKREAIGNEVLAKLVNSNDDRTDFESKCDLLMKIADTLTTEVVLKNKLEKTLEKESTAVSEMKKMFEAKEMQVLELQTEVKTLIQSLQELKVEHSKQCEQLSSSIDAKSLQVQKLYAENQSLTNELNDVKVKLEVKVHSLKEKLVTNEHITDKLKKTLECQIENLNVMVTKLTNYLKEKSIEVDAAKKEKDRLQNIIDDSCKVIQSLHDEIRIEKQNQDQMITDFESERLVLKNMITVTESVMEDQKNVLNNIIEDHVKAKEILQDEINDIKVRMETERKVAEQKIQEKDVAIITALDELTLLRKQKEVQDSELRAEIQLLTNKIICLEQDISKTNADIGDAEAQIQTLKAQNQKLMKDLEEQTQCFMTQITNLKEVVAEKESCLEIIEMQNNNLTDALGKLREDIHFLETKDKDLQTKTESLEMELLDQLDKLTNVLKGETYNKDRKQSSLHEKLQTKVDIQEKIKILGDEIIDLVKENNEYNIKLNDLKADIETKQKTYETTIQRLETENSHLSNVIEDNKSVIINLKQVLKHGIEESDKSLDNAKNDKATLEHKCSILQEYQEKAEKLLEDNEKEITSLKANQASIKSEYDEEVKNLTSSLNLCNEMLKEKETVIASITQEKELIENRLAEELASKERYKNDIVSKAATVYELGQKLEDMKHQVQILEACKNDNEVFMKVGQRDSCTVAVHEKVSSHRLDAEKDHGHQVSSSTSDLGHSSMESLKTITDLEKIIHDKNRTITTLQSDITYMKSLTADSENKLLDVTKELDLTKEHCEQLSSQLKKIVQQKNDEIADLKKQVSKMSVTENRASQIIKVSSKYQAIILKRIAEIKSNTILKELTNFGNAANCDSEVKRNLISGSITMEDLENFLETTDKHLKRCSDKQQTLQKERDRLAEVNRINESEIINLKKFLTELSVSFKTFSSVKELYAQKLTKIVSLQRTVRREILNLDGHVTDVAMCKLERGYAATMQDLSECAMNLERWVERCIGRTISPEKIKQAFTSNTDRNSLATLSFQNASLEVQLEELEKSFEKLLEEVLRAQKGEGAKDPQSVTVMEVRAEYEDKLNRMKAKMKQLYQEQIAVFKEKQKDEIAVIEGELQKARDKLAESSRAYEEHIRHLTNELWSVGEKFLMKKDEAEWLRRKQKSGSLMSLQHVHSSGLMGHPEPPPRPSDTHSLRSLPVNPINHPKETGKRENRGLHMSDEEGEVFDNRCLRELSTPQREPPGARLSELRWRNSLCPPHLKSSYPAETQFAPVDEDEIKANASNPRARKEVGITAYKKPGPPTPSKQAGRLSATDSELRESVRYEGEPAPTHAMRKTSTPSRLRALFTRSQTNEGTPRRRLSHIFRKK